MDSSGLRHCVTDEEEEVVFDNAPSTVKEAVQRWEREWQPTKNMGMTSIPLNDDDDDDDNDSSSNSNANVDRYYDDEACLDCETNDSQRFVARSLTAKNKLGRAVHDDVSTSRQPSQVSKRQRPDPPASSTMCDEDLYSTRRPFLVVPRLSSLRGGQAARFSPLPQQLQSDEALNAQVDLAAGAAAEEGEEDDALPDAEQGQQYHHWRFSQYSWFRPTFSSSSSSSTTTTTTSRPLPPRRRTSCCSWLSCPCCFCCRKSTCVRLLCFVVSTALLVLALLVPLGRRHQAQTVDLRRLHLVDFLAQLGISTRQDLEGYGSPQYRAVEWLTSTTIRPWGWTTRKSKDLVLLDRYVLAVLYYSLGGDQWQDKWNFMSLEHVCEWKSSSAANDNDMVQGVSDCQPNENGVLVPTGITLSFDSLSGTLPDEIRHLSHLQTLRIEHNLAMGGSLPSAIQQLTLLQTLSLQGCSMGGSLPTWLEHLTALETLALGNNRFRGAMPVEVARLTHLRVLQLNGNLLTGSLDVLRPLSNLEILQVQDNLLRGNLEESLLANLTRLVDLNASENQISGALPDRLVSHPSLKRIDLHGNRLSGTMPVPVDEPEPANVHLQVLHLQSNELEGSIPTQLVRLVALEDLDLSMNTLTGSIPDVSLLARLVSLSLSDNDFAPQTIPKSILHMGTLQRLLLSQIHLTGTISDSIGFLSNLQVLDLSGNSLTGTLPEGLAYLTLLEQFSARYNALSGMLPDNMFRLVHLDALLLEGNRLNGTADSICSEQQPGINNISYFSSDCDNNNNAASGGNDASNNNVSIFQCSCCTLCCGEHGSSCNRDIHPDYWG